MTQVVQRPMSLEMYNFLSTMKVAESDVVVNQGNVIDKTETYISKMYTPQLKVSNATKTLLDNLGVIAVIDMNAKLESDSITYWLLNSGLKTKDLKLYNLFKAVIADIYSYTYALDENPDYLRFINKKDFARTINNVSYLIDYLSGSNDNSSVLVDLYDINASLGVIKNQLDHIKDGSLDGEV